MECWTHIWGRGGSSTFHLNRVRLKTQPYQSLLPLNLNPSSLCCIVTSSYWFGFWLGLAAPSCLLYSTDMWVLATQGLADPVSASLLPQLDCGTFYLHISCPTHNSLSSFKELLLYHRSKNKWFSYDAWLYVDTTAYNQYLKVEKFNTHLKATCMSCQISSV